MSHTPPNDMSNGEETSPLLSRTPSPGPLQGIVVERHQPHQYPPFYEHVSLSPTPPFHPSDLRPSDSHTLPPGPDPLAGVDDDIRNLPLYYKDTIPRNDKPTIDQIIAFWETYNRSADAEDRETVKALGGSLDVLLIFAGLFSAVNTSFIIEAMKAIQRDQPERTNELVRSLILIVHNSTFTDDSLQLENFTAIPQAVRSCSLFFASLCCSIIAAFGAVIGKQWLSTYEREGALKPPAQRGRERQKKFEGRNKWHLETVVEVLPTLLQISLFIFMVALIDYLWPLSNAIASVVIGFTLLTFIFWVTTTVIAIADSSAPFQTRLASSLRPIPSLISQFGFKLQAMGKRRVRNAEFRLFQLRTLAVWQWPILLYRELGLLAQNSFKSLLRLWQFLLPNPNPKQKAIGDLAEKEDYLSWGCIFFLMQRTTLSNDLKVLSAAIDSLSDQDLKEDRRNEIGQTLMDTLCAFLLRPAWDDPRRTVVLGLPTADLQPLLKVIHILLVRWEWLRDHSVPVPANPQIPDLVLYEREFIRAIGNGLWNLFPTIEPEDNESLVFLSEILSKTDVSVPSWRSRLPIERCLERWLETPPPEATTEERQMKISLYITLLSCDRDPSFLLLGDSRIISKALMETMWLSQDKPDIDYWRGNIRAYCLPITSYDGLQEARFSEYLLYWWDGCRKKIYQTSESRSTKSLYYRLPKIGDIIQHYLYALQNLLERDSSFWSETLEMDGHLPNIVEIIRGIPEYDQLRGIALAQFLSIWDNRRVETPVEASDPELLYFSPGHVSAVVDAIINATYGMALYVASGPSATGSIASPMMERLSRYLEEAARRDVLAVGDMHRISHGYKVLGDLMDRELKITDPSESAARFHGRIEISFASQGERIIGQQ